MAKEDTITKEEGIKRICEAIREAYAISDAIDDVLYEMEQEEEYDEPEQDEEEIITLILSYLTGFEEEKILYSNYNEAEKKVYEQAVYVMNTFDNFLIVKVPNPNIQLLKNIVRQNW